MRSSRIIRSIAATAAFGLVAMPGLAAAASNTLVSYASSWRVLDNGTDQTPAALPSATHFAAPTYVESAAWRTETVQSGKVLGYGDNTRASFPTQTPNLFFSPTNALPNTNKYITTYFRQSFTVADASAVSALVLHVRRDDGIIVFVNGTEVARDNMPAGAYTSTTFASSIIDSAAEYAEQTINIPTTSLVTGQNLIAIELHQRDGTSSDITFAAELVATTLDAQIPEAPVTVLLSLGGVAVLGAATVVTRRRAAA